MCLLATRRNHFAQLGGSSLAIPIGAAFSASRRSYVAVSLANATRSFTVPVLGALLLASACNFSTAHISSVKLGKDKAVTQESATFAPTDTIYAIAEIGNAG